MFPAVLQIQEIELTFIVLQSFIRIINFLDTYKTFSLGNGQVSDELLKSVLLIEI